MRKTQDLQVFVTHGLALACLLLAKSSAHADSPYYSDGAQFQDGQVHTINSGTYTGGNAMSQSFVNYLTGIELDGGGLVLNGGTVIGGNSANNSAANYLTGIEMLGGVADIYGGTITGGTATQTSSANYLFGLEVINGVANIYGGSISAGTATANSDVNYVYGIEVVGGTVNIHGGHLSSGTINGGTAFNYVEGLDAVSGTVNIYGFGFNLPSGPVTVSGGVLTGTLQDGSPLNLSFDQVHSGQIVLYTVPEPAMAALSILAILAAITVRKRPERSSCRPAGAR